MVINKDCLNIIIKYLLLIIIENKIHEYYLLFNKSKFVKYYYILKKVSSIPNVVK